MVHYNYALHMNELRMHYAGNLKNTMVTILQMATSFIQWQSEKIFGILKK